ncbi:MAG: polyphosphate kinase 2 [Saprospiraceae bacterium]|nr:polyphosphate kinase 2 [Saprospiraceae bacterium]
MKLSNKDLAQINSKQGLYSLLRKEKLDLPQVLAEVNYGFELRKKQEELIKLQNWVIREGKKVVILFEGRDAAGKGGAIRRITERINPRHFRIVALDIPTADERRQWFLQRYINQLPKPGEMVFFDRSWYNRAVVEPVNKFCTPAEYRIFMNQVNDFERMIVESDTALVKLYFSISKKEQARRFAEIKQNPLKRWKMTAVDEKAQSLWNTYTIYKRKMFAKTDTKLAPWITIDANKKTTARLKAIDHILQSIKYS